MIAKILLLSLAILFLFVAIGCGSIQRKLLYFPSHHDSANGLNPWTEYGRLIGFSRQTQSPKNIWLMLHGNAGQAADRTYALPCFSTNDTVFIMEYPGYGKRPGSPSMNSFNAAAQEAYLLLRKTFPTTPICVAGESIGTGPASYLATVDPAPDKIVLMTPFDVLASVAKDHMPNLLVKLMLKDKWDNVSALSQFKGAVQIFGAASDTVIPPYLAQALAAAIPNAKLIMLDGGHNDWSSDPRVQIRNP